METTKMGNKKRKKERKDDLRVHLKQKHAELAKNSSELSTPKTKVEQAKMPTFVLRELGEFASLTKGVNMRTPILLSDIQHLIMYSLLESNAPYNPARWCKLQTYKNLKMTSVLIFDSLSIDHYQSQSENFPFVKSAYTIGVETLSEKMDSDIIAELVTVPITSIQKRKYAEMHGNFTNAVDNCDEIYDMRENVFPMNFKSNGPPSEHDRFPRTDLLLSGWQMVEENIPLPIRGLWEIKYKDYVMTKSEYQPVTAKSPMFGLDCEMCRTTNADLELTRVSITNESYDIVYDELVRPENEIVDYLTKFSGITPNLMKNVTKRLADVQKELCELLPADAILVGQSINNDLHALKMMHPYVIDTSVIYNLKGLKGQKSRLQMLSRTFLGERIQEARNGHCSAEDSIASLKLVQLKLRKDPTFGDASSGSLLHLNTKTSERGDVNYALSMFQQLSEHDKTVSVICQCGLAAKYSYFTFKDESIRSDTNISITEMKSIEEIVDEAAQLIDCDLQIAHLKLNSHSAVSQQNADTFIQRYHDNLPCGALSIVIFAGHVGSGKGCCFIKIKN